MGEKEALWFKPRWFKYRLLLRTLQWFTVSPKVTTHSFQKPARLHKSCSPSVLTESPSPCTCPCSLSSTTTVSELFLECYQATMSMRDFAHAPAGTLSSGWNTELHTPANLPSFLSQVFIITPSQRGFFQPPILKVHF